jgi:hypothetical protein
MKEAITKDTITLQVNDEVRQRLEQLALRDGREVETEASELLRVAVEIAAEGGLLATAGVVGRLTEAAGGGATNEADATQAVREARERALAGLAGTWTREEADEFDRLLAEQRQIDWELWK